MIVDSETVDSCSRREITSILSRQDQRRLQGIPTISTIVGPIGIAQGLWRSWSRAIGCEVVVVQARPNGWAAPWIESVFQSQDLYDIAARRLARELLSHEDEIRTRLSNITVQDLRWLLDRAKFDENGSGPNALAASVLLSHHQGMPIRVDRLVRLTQNSVNPDHSSEISLLRQFLHLVSLERVPTLLIRAGDCRWNSPGEAIDVNALLAEQCQAAVSLATQIPELRLGFAVTHAVWQECVVGVPDSFIKAALCENQLSVQGWSQEQVVERLESRTGRVSTGPHDERTPSSDSFENHKIEQLRSAAGVVADIGATETLVDSLADACECLELGTTNSPDSLPAESAEIDNESTAWKSAQERFLFELLDHHDELGGLFELNSYPGFDFGGRPAEIDLLCRSLKIAIEIDGYFHFTDAECYRRDRRKDRLLQEHDFFVLRFLAEDIVPEIERTLDTVLATVALRQS